MRVTISGGVHGNELLGIYLVKTLQKERFSFKNIKVDYLLGNLKAIKECRRYIDFDLNRSFSKESLTTHSHIYEFERAKVIKGYLKDSDFLIDIHTTTANMGVTVVLSKDDYLSNAVAKSLAATFDDVKILRWFSNDEGDFINSLVASSITIEVGPIPQGVLDAKAFFRAKEIIKWVLKILDTQKFCTKEIECYDIFDIVKFPRENGELKAMIHPKLLNFDYKKLYRGYPIFLTFENEEIFFNQESAYAVFINEAAYYEKDIAFCLTKKTKI